MLGLDDCNIANLDCKPPTMDSHSLLPVPTQVGLQNKAIGFEDLHQAAFSVIPLSKTMREQLDHIRFWAYDRAVRASPREIKSPNTKCSNQSLFLFFVYFLFKTVFNAACLGRRRRRPPLRSVREPSMFLLASYPRCRWRPHALALLDHHSRPAGE